MKLHLNQFLFLADFLEEHRRVLESRLQPVLREITDSRARTREELESLYRKIVSAVLLRSGLGSPTDIAVVREATGINTALWVKFSADGILKYFSYFFKQQNKTGFDISCKLETVCMKCQNLFSGKNKINIINLLSAD